MTETLIMLPCVCVKGIELLVTLCPHTGQLHLSEGMWEVLTLLLLTLGRAYLDPVV